MPESRRNPRVTPWEDVKRSQQRYRQFLNADCGLSFREWLRATAEEKRLGPRREDLTWEGKAVVSVFDERGE
jgi:hypothetical protein